jgi:hypothetical protein
MLRRWTSPGAFYVVSGCRGLKLLFETPKLTKRAPLGRCRPNPGGRARFLLSARTVLRASRNFLLPVAIQKSPTLRSAFVTM